MPLASTSGPGVQHFVQNRESANSHASLTTRSITPQPQEQRNRSRQKHGRTQNESRARSNSHNGASGKRHIFAHDPESLKLQIPNTLRKTVSAIPQNDPNDTGRGSSASAVAKTRTSRQHEISAFDDTQSIHFDDSTSILDDDVDLTLQFGHESNERFPLEPSKTVHREGHGRPRQDHVKKPLALGHNALLSGDWRAQVEKEKRLQRQFGPSLDAHHGHAGYIDQAYGDAHNERYEEDVEFADKEPYVWQDTPSRPRPGIETKLSPRPKIDDSKQNHVRPSIADEPESPPLPTRKADLLQHAPVEPLPEVVNRFKVRQPLGADSPIDQPAADNNNTKTSILQPQPRTHTNPPFSSKVSSYHESSSEEDQAADDEPSTNPPSVTSTLPASGTKRPHDAIDIDYDAETLKTKTLAELDGIPFTLDPSLPTPQPALDSNGNAMSLSAKLTNLTKMRAEDQTQLFRVQTDAEREETAMWFLDKFRDDMQKLLRARVERRKVALRYEMLVKMRERKVTVKKADVQSELDALKKGGGELIAGRART
ncbi:hypothetical protein LTR84_012629 [Exophiala bonariae]|uniref:Extracellular mutant protein 11 C-terminal domain-containing protein n=1 Tax=Exophiala bonariae TaxID=1690606 RepID=A0AAV9NFT2_9EURO|nr:hypothetical protein LTR84_012629 [Exophiala bonariae]